ncbi:MAG: hypothetical protein VX777_02430 [Chlamydiota bacterium]|nr:hypothetical protein [Chlamydiota bacterium]
MGDFNKDNIKEVLEFMSKGFPISKNEDGNWLPPGSWTFGNEVLEPDFVKYLIAEELIRKEGSDCVITEKGKSFIKDR